VKSEQRCLDSARRDNDEIEMTNDELTPNDQMTKRFGTLALGLGHYFGIRASSFQM